MHGPLTRPPSWFVTSTLLGALCSVASAELIPARHLEGTEHGFLVLRTMDGRVVTVGDLYQVVHSDTVSSRLLFRFKDGSVDDETTVFSQRNKFQLITYHHVQNGPSFPQPLDLLIDAMQGQVTSRTKGKDGKEEVESEHIDTPADLANGIALTIAKNIEPDAAQTPPGLCN
jgi:hypothetical protein